MEQKVVIVGPSGVGKSQIYENFIKGENTEFVTSREATTVAQHKTIRGADLWDVAGAERFHSVLSMYVRDATVVLLVVDPETLRNNEKSLSPFLESIFNHAPHNATVKIVVNKIDGNETVESIKQIWNEKISQDLKKALRNPNFDPKNDAIYYSAKDTAEKLNNWKLEKEQDPLKSDPLEQDPIIQPIRDSAMARTLYQRPIFPVNAQALGYEKEASLQARATYKSIFPEIDWDVLWNSKEWKFLKSKLPLVGKVLLFILLAAALTAVIGAIGFGIGLAAGAWTGPGAFVSAIAGAFAGAITAWNLAVLIAAPVLGLAFTGIGFGLFERWHRETPPKVYNLISEKPDNPDLGIELQDMSSDTPSPESSVIYEPILNPTQKPLGKDQVKSETLSTIPRYTLTDEDEN